MPYYSGFISGMIRPFILSVFVCCVATSLWGQGSQTDSLRKALETTSAPEEMVDILNQLAYNAYDYDAQTAFEYASRALEIAGNFKYPKGKRFASSLTGYYYFDKGDYKRALTYYDEAAQVKIPPDVYSAYNAILTGNLYRVRASYDSAELFYNRGISLLNSLKTTRFLAYAYRNLGRLYLVQWKNVQAESVFKKALALHEKSGSKFGRAETYFALAELKMHHADYLKANEFINDGCDLATELEDPYLVLNCQINRGEIQFKLGDFQSSLNLFLKALDLLKTRDAPHTVIRVYSDIADVYEALGQNELGLRYYYEALKEAERLGLKYESARLNTKIAWVYKNQKKFSPAFEYLDKALEIRQAIKDEFGVAQTYNVRGVILFQQKNYDEAVEWIRKALVIRQRIGYPEGVSACLFNLGLIYEEQKKYREALDFQRKALQFERKTGNKFNIAIAFSSIGSLFTHLKQYDSAQYYLKMADDLASQTTSLELLMENAFYWSQYYEMTGDTRTALDYHKKYSALNDSMYQDNSASKLAEMHALYQTDQKDKEITLLNKDKLLQSNQLQLQDARINLQNYIIIFVIVAFVLVSLLAYKTYQYNREIKGAHNEIVHQKEELQAQSEELQKAYKVIAQNNKLLEAKVDERTSALMEAYKELDTFFYRASHDFRRPLTTFMGLVEVANITVKDRNARELFQKVRETAINLDKMLLKLQTISDLGSQQLIYGEVNLHKIFHDIHQQFRQEISDREIIFSSSVHLHETFYSYPSMVQVVLENLVENSIAFSRYEGAFLRLSATQTDREIILEVADNGDGIEKKYHEKIFEMYFRGNDRSKGNGLGLYIIKKALDKLRGGLKFSSERDKGTTFWLTFPLYLPDQEEVQKEVTERMHL